MGFTAYVGCIHHESPTKVGTYAYVNPVVAVLVGYFLGGEAHRPANDSGDVAGAGERGGDHDDVAEERKSFADSGITARAQRTSVEA